MHHSFLVQLKFSCAFCVDSSYFLETSKAQEFKQFISNYEVSASVPRSHVKVLQGIITIIYTYSVYKFGTLILFKYGIVGFNVPIDTL